MKDILINKAVSCEELGHLYVGLYLRTVAEMPEATIKSVLERDLARTGNYIFFKLTLIELLAV